MSRTTALGTAMVELVIITPFLLILVFGIAEFGRALYQEQILVKSVASAARYIARAYAVLNVDDTTKTCTKVGSWTTREGEAKTLAIKAGGANPVIPNLTVSDVTVDVNYVDVESASGVSDVGGVCVISVSIDKKFEGIFGESMVPFADIGPLILNARSEEVYIGE